MVLSRLIIIIRGKAAPQNSRKNPRITNLVDIFILFIEPALDEMVRSGLELRRLFEITKTFNEARAPWVESATCRRIDQAGGLARRHIFESRGIRGIGVRDSVK